MGHKIKKEWTTEAGLKAVVLFVNDSHHCGYVIVPEDHKWYGDSYDKHYDVDVHGGLTYADTVYWEEGDNYGWAFGFDAAHLGDETLYSRDPGDTFKDVDYMAKECESLARQIKEEKSDDTNR